MRSASVAVLLLTILCLSPGLACGGEITLPAGADFMRLGALERELTSAGDEAQAKRMADNQKMAVYIDLLGISKDTEAQLLGHAV